MRCIIPSMTETLHGYKQGNDWCQFDDGNIHSVSETHFISDFPSSFKLDEIIFGFNPNSNDAIVTNSCR